MEIELSKFRRIGMRSVIYTELYLWPWLLGRGGTLAASRDGVTRPLPAWRRHKMPLKLSLPTVILFVSPPTIPQLSLSPELLT